IRKKVFKYLFNTYPVRIYIYRQTRFHIETKVYLFVVRHFIKQHFNINLNLLQSNLFYSKVHFTRFDFRKIENVVNQRKQIASGIMNYASIFNLFICKRKWFILF